jgi:hypothetical protein
MPWTLLLNKWALGAAALGALGLALWGQTARLDAARKSEAASAQVAVQWRTNFEAMEATNAANLAALETLKAEALRIEGLATSARTANAKLSIDIETLRRRIAHASPDDDGPVRPVLCDTVNELRRLAAQPGPACGR